MKYFDIQINRNLKKTNLRKFWSNLLKFQMKLKKEKIQNRFYLRIRLLVYNKNLKITKQKIYLKKNTNS